jgi:hypothetical protein
MAPRSAEQGAVLAAVGLDWWMTNEERDHDCGLALDQCLMMRPEGLEPPAF